MDVKAILSKRVAGIPMLYIGVLGVVILAIVAWRMKPKPEEPVSGDEGSDGESGSGDGLAEGGTVTTADFDGTVYDGLKTSGTVVVAPTPPSQLDAPVYTNEDWIKDGSAYLVTENKATGSEAATALSKYINGQDRSYNENALVDAWIAKKGLPPSMPDSTGNVGAKKPAPVLRQGRPPCVHRVKGAYDNTLAEIAGVYYGRRDGATIDLMQAANPNMRNDAGPFPVGYPVKVPVWHAPKYYTTPKVMSSREVAGKNGISAWQIEVLNNTTRTTWKKGVRVRVG